MRKPIPGKRLGETSLFLFPFSLFLCVLLQEGRDWPAAEHALREVLALDPHHVEANRNLALLRRRQGRNVA
jgi:hypothetical protein